MFLHLHSAAQLHLIEPLIAVPGIVRVRIGNLAFLHKLGDNQIKRSASVRRISRIFASYCDGSGSDESSSKIFAISEFAD
jgi:hypothetical protein